MVSSITVDLFIKIAQAHVFVSILLSLQVNHVLIFTG